MMKKNLLKKQMYLLGMATVLSLTGCRSPKELAAKEDYDILIDESAVHADWKKGDLIQILDVPGENFQLYTQYGCDPENKREWRITSDKFLYINVKTLDLPSDTLVYIDNVHIDTSIKSKYASYDGILQDTMDDRVHSSQLIGFHISDTAFYYGVNAIEGTNANFIQGSLYGGANFVNASIRQERFTEAYYMKGQVYANKIQIVYDLLIKGPNDFDFRNVSVETDFLVPVSSTSVSYEKDGEVFEKEYSLDLKN